MSASKVHEYSSAKAAERHVARRAHRACRDIPEYTGVTARGSLGGQSEVYVDSVTPELLKSLEDHDLKVLEAHQLGLSKHHDCKPCVVLSVWGEDR